MAPKKRKTTRRTTKRKPKQPLKEKTPVPPVLADSLFAKIARRAVGIITPSVSPIIPEEKRERSRSKSITPRPNGLLTPARVPNRKPIFNNNDNVNRTPDGAQRQADTVSENVGENSPSIMTNIITIIIKLAGKLLSYVFNENTIQTSINIISSSCTSIYNGIRYVTSSSQFIYSNI